ncbi:MAG TPA: hypothetical protein VHW23_25170 [Kofleriaceae bacterium]|nr:hypothetical protein [Kofleriaceae bacterium]
MALAIGIAVAGVAVAIGLVISRGAGSAARGDSPVAPVGASSSAGPHGSTPGAAPPAAARAAPAPAAPAPAAPAIVKGSELGLDAEVSGTLEPDGVRRHPFTVPRGRYYVELFARAPDPPDARCGQPARVGNQFGGFTWAHDSWEKHQEVLDLAGGTYQVSVLARKACRVHFRVRLSNAS